MQIFWRIFNFYILSNIHVALGTYCFVRITLNFYGIEEESSAWFVFFATVLSYNFIRFANVSKKENWMTHWFGENKGILIVLSGLCFLGLIFFVKKLSAAAFFFLFPFILITYFYGVKLTKKGSSLRRIPGFKIFLIAFCYAGITTIFPLIQNKIEIGFSEIVLFIERLLFVLLITLPFDVRDMDFDSEKLQTIPQRIGVRKTKFLGVFFGLCILLLDGMLLEKTSVQLIVFNGVVLLAVLLLLNAKRIQSKYYSSFWVEAVPIFWYLLILLSLKF